MSAFDDIPFGLIVGDDLHHIVSEGIITGITENAIQPISIDVRLHDRILSEMTIPTRVSCELNNKPTMISQFLSVEKHVLTPGEFILAGLEEIISLPDNITAVFHLRSTMARLGINHSISIHMVPGWTGRLTLELTNGSRQNYVELFDKMEVGTIMFYKHKMTRGYSGRYNNQTEIRC